MAPDGSEDVLGNTIPKRCNASKHWVFTLNNYTNNDIDELLGHVSNGSIKRYIWQSEMGAEGTPHLQGYIEFDKKKRPKESIKLNSIHWEVCRDIKASIKYCSKEDTWTGERWANIKYEKPIKIIENLYSWQKDIIDIVASSPDDRIINWYWEPVGNVGKSTFCKYLAVKFDALVLSGKGADCKYAIIKWYDKYGYYPDLIIYDVPRSYVEYINFESLESIKNGLFFSGKYESGQVVMNCPHVFVFANSLPDTSQMSADRWRISRIRTIESIY